MTAIRRLNRFFLLAILAFVLTACAASNTRSVNSRSKQEKASSNALVHTQLARSYMQQKQYAIAKDELEQALESDPNHSDSNYVMALLMLELKQYDEADKHFSTALKNNSENASAAHDYGMFLCQTNEQLRSVTYFDQASSNPFFDKPELSLMRAGECLAQVGDKRAEQYLSKALAVNSTLSPALVMLANLKYGTQEYLSARAYIERYFAITKQQPGTLLLAYKIESALDDQEMANKYKKRLLEGFPGSSQATKLRTESRN